MQRQAHNPPDLMPSAHFSHALSVSGATRHVYVSGQVAVNARGEVQAPGDLAAQTRLAMENLRTALRAAGADTTDIVKLNIYVTNLQPAELRTVREIRSAYLCPDPLPAVTLVGVQALAFEGLRIEIEAVAAVG